MLDALSGKFPVNVITGSLGSGKSTLINKLLKLPEMSRVAVIINESGEQAIENDLVEVTSERMMQLSSGCSCCLLRGDLQKALRDLFVARRNGSIMDFNRVVIETTGRADPAAIMQTLMTDEALLPNYRLDSVVTLLDAVNGSSQLDTTQESVKQAALADRIVVTKSDVAGEESTARLEQHLRALNRLTPVERAVGGEIDLDFLINVGLRNAKGTPEDIARWMGSYDEIGDADTHGGPVRSYCVRLSQAMAWDTFLRTMEVLSTLRGADMLRVKGLVNVADYAGPMVIQGVQHLFQPPVELRAWPSDDRSTRLIFITRNIPKEAVVNLFAAIGAVSASAIA